VHVVMFCGWGNGWLLITKTPKMASNKVVTTLSHWKRHFSINIDDTVLAVVPSLRHFNGACSDVLWWEHGLFLDNETATRFGGLVLAPLFL
jgi:hypothetical protein